MARYDPSQFPEYTRKDIRRTILVDESGDQYNDRNTQSYVSEGTATGSTVLAIGFTSNVVEIINDGSVDLQFKFASGDTYATLKATESIFLQELVYRAAHQTTQYSMSTHIQ